MKVYCVSLPHPEDGIKCPGCNWEVTTLYYDDPKAAHRDRARVEKGERPEVGLCAECFLAEHAHYIPVE